MWGELPAGSSPLRQNGVSELGEGMGGETLRPEQHRRGGSASSPHAAFRPAKFLFWLCSALSALGLFACTNSPYPDADDKRKVLYSPFAEPPKTLDPAVGYSTADHAITGKVYDTLLEYHYLKRPYELMAGMAEEVPTPYVTRWGQYAFDFRLRDDLWFHQDACFSRPEKTRRVEAADFVFQLKRLADPKVGSPVQEAFSVIAGFSDFGRGLEKKRSEDPSFAKLPLHEQYHTLALPFGAQALDARTLRVVLDRAYPQILYWFAMPFASPLPFEAVAYYDGESGRADLAEHPVGSGPFVLSIYEKRSRMVLERNERWYGRLHPEWRAPGAVFPEVPRDSDLDAEDRAALQKSAGMPIPALERIEYRREEESIPAFSKFLQGYYDLSAVTRESFSRVIFEGGLSPEMKAKGMHLERSVVPAIYYIGFNLDDPVIGTKGGEPARLIRQAMSLSVDVAEYLRLFQNGRGVLAESPLPPALFGYDPAYRNPYRKVDRDRARELLKQAGYPGGIDPRTGRPLLLTFDVPDTSPEQRVRFQFWTEQWSQIGISVQISATNYNKFQEKVRDGAYQIFQWGWVADYPDPENFLFLLTTKMARSVSQGPNTANFKDAEFDALFERMQALGSGPERAGVILDMKRILERERPWIELFHPEDYALTHGFLKNVRPVGLSIPVAKYYDVDAVARSSFRQRENAPVLWPIPLAILAFLVLLWPAVRSYLKERV